MYLVVFLREDSLNEWLFDSLEHANHAARLISLRWGVQTEVIAYERAEEEDECPVEMAASVG